MCQFKSFIVTKGKKILYLLDEDSHETIVSHFNLNDNKESFLSNYVRLEITPLDYLFSKQKKNWNVNIDEKDAPEWFENRYDYYINECFSHLFRLIDKIKKTKIYDGNLEL